MGLGVPIGSKYSVHLVNYQRNAARAGKSLEQLSTGLKINRPSDDPAGWVGAEELRGEISRLESQIKTLNRRRISGRIEQSGASAILERLHALRDQATQLADGQITAAERDALLQEIDAGFEAIGQVRQTTAQIAERAGVKPTASPAATPDRGSTEDPAAIAEIVESGLDQALFSAAGLAAADKILEVEQTLTEDMLVTHTAALSSLVDADFAEAASELIQSQVLTQASLLALAKESQLQADLAQEILDSLKTEPVKS